MTGSQHGDEEPTFGDLHAGKVKEHATEWTWLLAAKSVS